MTVSSLARGFPRLVSAALVLSVALRAEEVQSSLVIVRPGTLPIILSAPHGGKEAIPGVPERKGAGIAQFTTVRDSNTDDLAAKIADDLEPLLGGKPYVVIARFARKYVDANRPANEAYESPAAKSTYDAYQAALQAACESVRTGWGAGLLVDVHGQSEKKDTVFRGTANLATLTHLKDEFGMAAVTGPDSILGQLAAKGYTLFPENGSSAHENPHFDGGYIVRTYGSAHGGTIDALQLESGYDYRMPARIPQTAHDYAEAIAVFARKYLPHARLATPPH